MVEDETLAAPNQKLIFKAPSSMEMQDVDKF